MKKTIYYKPHNNQWPTYPDGEVKSAVEKFLVGPDTFVVTSQELFVYLTRVMIKRGAISPEKVEFVFGDINIHPDKFGFLDKWPKGFCPYFETTIEELI